MAKISLMGSPESILVSHGSPHVQPLSPPHLNVRNIVVCHETVHDSRQNSILVRPDHVLAGRFSVGGRPRKVIWERCGQYRRFLDVSNFEGWRLTIVDQQRLARKLEVIGPVLEGSTPNNHGEVGAQLHFRNKLLPGRNFLPGFGADANSGCYAFHGAGRSGGLSGRRFYGGPLLVTGAQKTGGGAPQSIGKRGNKEGGESGNLILVGLKDGANAVDPRHDPDNWGGVVFGELFGAVFSFLLSEALVESWRIDRNCEGQNDKDQWESGP